MVANAITQSHRAIPKHYLSEIPVVIFESVLEDIVEHISDHNEMIVSMDGMRYLK